MGARAQVLLCWLQVLCAVVFGDVWKVKVESEMEALVSSCVVLPCSFKYPAEQQPSSRIKAMWHMKEKWEDFIYHNDPTRVQENFKGRTKLIGSLGALNWRLMKSKTMTTAQQASKPELQANMAVKEGEPIVFKCSVQHTCPSHQPTLSWSHPGNVIMSYKDIGHGKWEAESLLTFTPTKEDNHNSITCTVKYHGSVQGEMQATQLIIVKEQATLNHILIPAISGLGAALLVGLLCFFVVKRYKKRIADLQSRNDNGIWSRLSRMSRRFRSGEGSGGPGGREQ
ncbi:hypothetical protein ABG768_007865, partial [Culter alburnus]